MLANFVQKFGPSYKKRRQRGVYGLSQLVVPLGPAELNNRLQGRT